MGVNDTGRGWGSFIDAAPPVYKRKRTPKPVKTAVQGETADEETVRRLHALGQKDSVIARAIGCSASWVARLRKGLGLLRTGGRIRWSAGELGGMDRVVALKRELEAEILRAAEALGRTPRAIQEKLKDLTSGD